MARAVAAALLEMGVDIYFDERDAKLQAATAAEDDAAIVKCINDGLDKSTHLLGLLTEKTFKSWWVPYEIGGANGRERKCGHLISGKVTELPSYVSVAPILQDIDDLAGWLSKTIPLSTLSDKDAIKDKMTYQTRQQLIKSYIPEYRISSRVTFY